MGPPPSAGGQSSAVTNKDQLDQITIVAESAVETVKWVFVAFATLITALGGLLSVLGFKSLAAMDRTWKEVSEKAAETQKALTQIDELKKDIEARRMAIETELESLRETFKNDAKKMKESLKDIQRLGLDAADASTLVSALATLNMRELQHTLDEAGKQDNAEGRQAAELAPELTRMVKHQCVDHALEYLDEVEKNARTLENDRIVGWTNAMRSIVHLYSDNFDKAIEWGLRSKKPENNPVGYADRAYNLAQVYARRYSTTDSPQDREMAIAEFREAFRIDPSMLSLAHQDPDLLWYVAKGDRAKLDALLKEAIRAGGQDQSFSELLR
jgi:tetratricopeptide (TPR) repeat protein